jgi:hypothetical protein
MEEEDKIVSSDRGAEMLKLSIITSIQRQLSQK